MKKHLFFWASLLVAGLALTACGGDADDFSDKTTPVAPTGKQTWTVTVGAGVMTRGLNDDLSPNWSTDDEVYVYHGTTKVGTLKPTAASNDGSVTLSGELENSDYSTASGYNTLNLTYKYDFNDGPSYEGQNGTIADIAENYDFLNATVNITAVDNTAKTLTVSTANFETLQSVMKLTFTETLMQDDVLSINGAASDVTVTLQDQVNEGENVYVAVPFSKSLSSYDLSFTIKNSLDEEVYIAKEWTSKTLQNSKSYKATVNIEAVRMWEGGPFWAVKNLGAASKTDWGDFYAWGETVPHSTGYSFSWETYTLCDGTTWSDTKLKKFCNNSNYGTVDNLTQLTSDYDAATQQLGEPWRLPTYDELEDLINECSGTFWDSSNYTLIVTSSDRKIILPTPGIVTAAFDDDSNFGYYWSSSLRAEDCRDAYLLEVYDDKAVIQYRNRYCGISIRPVRDY